MAIEPRRRGIVQCAALALALALCLAGCTAEQGGADDAVAAVRAGHEQMEAWIASHCPQGSLVDVENVVWKLPGGPEQLLPCVRGTMTDGGEEREFFLDMETGEVLLQLNAKENRVFQRECLSYVLERLGLDERAVDVGGGERDAFFSVLLLRDAGEQDLRYWWGIDGYAASDYVKLPGQLVLARGSIGEYVRDTAREDVICVELDAYLPGNGDLSGCTMERIESIEEGFGFYFKELSLRTDAQSMSLLWDDDERFVQLVPAG